MKQVKVGFTGDVAFSRHYKDKYTQKGLVAPELVTFLTDNDYNVFNIEGAMCAPTHAGTFVHNNPPEGVALLSTMKPNIWNLANNHMMDAGPEGCMETLQHAAEAGSKTIGAGANQLDAVKPVILPEAGGIGIIGLGYQPGCVAADAKTPGCSSWDKLGLIAKTVAEVKKTCRWCVTVIHGGREFCDIPMQDIRDRYKSYLNMGVDVVVGHHPHVPQNWEKVGDKYIFYSLGNFIFDTDYQRAQFHTDTGVLLRLLFTEKEVTFEAVGTHIDRSTGVVSQGEVPAVFTPLTEEDYKKVYPLAAKRFQEHIVKRVFFLHPEDYPEGKTPETVAKILEDEFNRYPLPNTQLVMDEAARYDGKPLDKKYAALEAYLI